MIRYEYLGELQALLGHLVIYSIAVALQKFLKDAQSYLIFRNQSKKVNCTT